MSELALFKCMQVAMPEWLRGLTRNQMRSPRVGSNPTGDDLFLHFGKTAVRFKSCLWLQRASGSLLGSVG